jgi:hypothetical protein
MKLSKDETINTLLDAKYFLNMAIKNIIFSRIEIAKNIEFLDYKDVMDCKFMQVYLSSSTSELSQQINRIDNIIKTLK